MHQPIGSESQSCRLNTSLDVVVRNKRTAKREGPRRRRQKETASRIKTASTHSFSPSRPSLRRLGGVPRGRQGQRQPRRGLRRGRRWWSAARCAAK